MHAYEIPVYDFCVLIYVFNNARCLVVCTYVFVCVFSLIGNVVDKSS